MKKWLTIHSSDILLSPAEKQFSLSNRCSTDWLYETISAKSKSRWKNVFSLRSEIMFPFDKVQRINVLCGEFLMAESVCLFHGGLKVVKDPHWHSATETRFYSASLCLQCVWASLQLCASWLRSWSWSRSTSAALSVAPLCLH